MQRVYTDRSNSRSLKLQIYLRSIQFLFPSIPLYPFYTSLLDSSLGLFPAFYLTSIISMYVRMYVYI